MRLGSIIAVTAVVLAAGGGILAGWLLWAPPNYFAADKDPRSLPASPENDLIRTGWQIFVETPSRIGRSATDPARRYAGNDLACTNCHLNAGRTPFAAPLVSTFASYPLMVDDRVITLRERINGCMERSLNGRPLPEQSPEMNALIAFVRWIGKDSPVGVRVAGMGLKPLPTAAQTPDAARGQTVFAARCAECHGPEGAGNRKQAPQVGYAVPPLWGPDSFNAAAGMADLRMASAFIHANMPLGAKAEAPILTEQQAWDVAAFLVSRPRPPAPARSVASR